MSTNTKDTIYIDIDDEITSIIEKVQGSSHKIVALVLPKRAAMLQSIVNMKLLKKSADDAKKKLVLITSEAGLLPLAGAVGLYTAKTLQSKPEIPEAPSLNDATEEVAEDTPVDKSKPVGELAGDKSRPRPSKPSRDDKEDTIEVDSPEEEAAVTAATKPKADKSKKLKIPNFGKFRTRLFLGIGALILLIVGWYFGNFVLPSARITIQTDASTITSDLNVTVRPNLEELNEEQSIVPGKRVELRKTDTEKTAATGQKDVGKKASGQVTLSIPCNDLNGPPPTIPAGTGVSADGLTYIVQRSTALDSPNFNDGCAFTGTASVTAQNSGDQYNVGERTYTVAGYPNVTGFGSAMTGGTSKVIKVVRQEDVDKAKNALKDRNEDEAKDELKQQLEDEGFMALEETFGAADPEATNTPNVGDEADEVTVTSTIVYTMTGLKTEELERLIAKDVENEIDPSKQSILNSGLDRATFRVLNSEDNGDVRLNLQTLVTAGPQINEMELKEEIKGKKKGETVSIIQNRPGIKDVQIDFSPFWVFSTPRDTDKITITFEGSDANQSDATEAE